MSHAERNDSVPIFWRLGRYTACDGAAGAWSILDGELLAKSLRESISENSGGDVSSATRTKADQNVHRFCRPILRQRRRGSSG
jgi:hypothetical protein